MLNKTVTTGTKERRKDWNECLVAEVPIENMAKQMCWRDAREKPVPVMKMSEVEETVFSGYGIRSFPLERLL